MSAAAELDLRDPGVVISTLEKVTELNLSSSLRNGAVVELPDKGQLLMTGDLHDHGLNFARILKRAELDQRHNHLILHEVIHGPGRINGRDLSLRTLVRAAALKLRFPRQVHFLQSNHELSQISGEGILKGNISVVESFNEGVEFLYGEDADAVQVALGNYIRSLPLAVRCANGVFCSHSLPAPRKIDGFDKTVLDRVPTAEDLDVGGSAYVMVWGRHHTQKIADELAGAWNVDVFVMGHQPAEMGYDVQGDTMLILASDHERGVVLPIDLSMRYTREGLIDEIVPLASVVL